MFSRVVLVPEENLGIVVLTNSTTAISTAIANTILDAYLGSESTDWLTILRERDRAAILEEEQRRATVLAPTVSGTRPSLPLEAYAGTFRGEMYGDATVTLENGTLVLRLLPNPELVAGLRHRQHDTFTIEWRRPWPWFGSGVASFVIGIDGTIDELRLNVPNEDLWFHELELRSNW